MDYDGRFIMQKTVDWSLLNDGMPQGERLVKLNQIAIQQMQVLEDNEGRKCRRKLRNCQRNKTRKDT